MIGDSCIVENNSSKKVLESIGLTSEHSSFVDFCSVLPYLADFLYSEGIADRNINTTSDSLLEVIDNNQDKLEQITKVVKELIEIKNQMKFYEFDTIRQMVNSNSSEDILNFISKTNYINHKINDGNKEKLYEDLKFQLVKDLLNNKLTDNFLKACGLIVKKLNLTDETATNGVIIDTRLKNYTDENTKAIARQWLKNNPNGIVAFRLSENYNTIEMAKAGAIGNPFNRHEYDIDIATQMFEDWLITGNNFGESLATEEYRQAIINKIKSIDTPNILYYKELNRPSHATVLGYLINHKDLLNNKENLVNLSENTTSQTKNNKKNIYANSNGEIVLTDEQNTVVNNTVESNKNGLDIKTTEKNSISTIIPTETDSKISTEEQPSIESSQLKQLNNVLEQNIQEDKQTTSEINNYTIPLNNTPIVIQQNKVNSTMSVQEKADAVKNISKWFINFIEQVLAYDTQTLFQKKSPNKSLISIKAKQERINEDLFKKIAFEKACKKPNIKNIEYFKKKIIPLNEIEVVKLLGVKEIAKELKRFIDSKPELKLISDNFDALFIEASSLINYRYNINITGNFNNYDAIDDIHNINDQTDTEKTENVSPENNYIRSDDRSRSTESSLSQDIKRIYDKCIIRDNNGILIKDSFGFNQTIDPSIAHTTMLKYTQNIIDFDDMMDIIKNSKESWINSVESDGTVKKGCLRYFIENNEQLANSFYYNYKGSAQKNCIIQKGKDGLFRIISINEVNSSEISLKTTISNIESGNIFNKYSIYNNKGQIDKNNIKKLINKITKLINIVNNSKFNQLSSEFFQELVSILNSLGFSTSIDFNILECIKFETDKTNPTERDLKNATNNLLSVFSNICKILNESDDININIIQECKGLYNSLSKFMFVGEKELAESSITEKGKTFNTYGKTNYIDELFKHLKQVVKDKKGKDGKEGSYYTQWLKQKFGDSAFFRYNGIWLSDWLEKLTRFDQHGGNKYRNLLERVNIIDSNVLNTKSEFTKWDETTSTLSNFLAYLNNDDTKLDNNEKSAYYRMPIASNSPAGDFIKFIKYVSSEKTSYEDILISKLWKVCKQELIRINDVSLHLQKNINGKSTTPDISSYDATLDNNTNNPTLKTAGGLAFCFLPRLNYVKIGTKHTIFEKEGIRELIQGKSFLDAIRVLDNAENRTKYNLEDSDLEQLFKEVYLEDFNKDFAEEYKYVKPMLLKNNQLNKLEENSKLEEAYREYVMNYNFAFTQMVQLTCTDLAFFGKKTIEETTEEESNFRHTFTYNGKTYTKFYKITSDNALDVFQKRNKQYHAPTKKINTSKKSIFREAVFEDIELMSEILDNVKASIINNPHLSNNLKNNIITTFNKINVADGQSYRSLRSYMEVLEAAGKLDEETKECFTAILNNKYDDGMFYKVALALKPYFYSTLRSERDTTDANGNPYISMNPTQHKNSEYPLMVLTIAAGALNKSTVLKGINKFMSDNNIDVVHFESVVKVGLDSKLSINLNLATAKDIANYLKNQITDEKGNEINIKKIPVADWGIQTDKPEHLIDKQQLIGSQPRRMVLADIPDDPNYRINVDGIQMTKKQFVEEYQKLISQELLDKFSQVDNIFKDIKVLSRFLQDNVVTSNKYDDDMIRMFTIDAEGKNFILPFWDATVSNKVDELLNALIRNKIVKQYIRGGAVVQTAAVGLTNELNVRYKVKDEKTNTYRQIKTYREWLKENPNGTHEQYENTEAKDAILDYMECYLPFWSKELMDKYIVDGKIIADDENFPEELRYLVGYRVPTEDHYSMAPLKVVGFLSPTEGSSIVLPADITAIAGSDFDIDVMYLMIPEHKIYKYDIELAKADYSSNINPISNNLYKLAEINEDNLFSHEYEDFNRWFNLETAKDSTKYLLPKKDWKIKKVKYYIEKGVEENSIEARHNRFIDMTFSAITAEHSLEKFTNPQNYDSQKLASRLIELNSAGYTYEDLLKKISDKDIKTQIKYLDLLVAATNKKRNIASPKVATDLHQQNMIGNDLISIFAVANGLQQILEYFPMKVTKTFIINNNESNSNEFILGRMRNAKGQLITKILAGYLGASVDNGKDPIMKALLANPQTAKYITYLVMLGYEPLEIGTFMNIPAIKSILLNDGKYTPLKKEDYTPELNSLLEKSSIKNLTLSEMMLAAREPNSLRAKAINDVAIQILDSIIEGADTLSRKFSQILRVDSTNGNVSKSTLDAIYKVNIANKLIESYTRLHEKGKDFIFEPIKNNTNPSGKLIPLIYNITTNKESIKNIINHAVLPYLQAFNSCALTASIKWLGDYTLYNNCIDFINTYILNDKWSDIKKDQVFRKFCGEFQLYHLLNNPIFGKEETITYRDKFIYYRDKFPKEFIEFVQELPVELKNNQFLKNICYVGEEKNSKNKYAHLESTNLGTSKHARGQIKKGFDELMDINPNMAIKLFVYSAFTYGLSFNSKGWCHLTSSEFKLNIPGYVKNVFDLKTITPSEEFIEYFIKNNYINIKGLIPLYDKDTEEAIKLYTETTTEGTDKLSQNDISKLMNKIAGLPKYFQTNGNLYHTQYKDNILSFVKLDRLGYNNYYHEYYPNSIFDQKELNENNIEDEYYDENILDFYKEDEISEINNIDEIIEETTDKKILTPTSSNEDSIGELMC